MTTIIGYAFAVLINAIVWWLSVRQAISYGHHRGYFKGLADGEMIMKNAAVGLGFARWECRMSRAVDAPPENRFHWSDAPKKDDPAR